MLHLYLWAEISSGSWNSSHGYLDWNPPNWQVSMLSSFDHEACLWFFRLSLKCISICCRTDAEIVGYALDTLCNVMTSEPFDDGVFPFPYLHPPEIGTCGIKCFVLLQRMKHQVICQRTLAVSSQRCSWRNRVMSPFSLSSWRWVES